MSPAELTARSKADRHAAALGDCHECRAADLASLERTRWFARQVVGPEDLIQDQLYFRERHRRHNRLLHGWGIVCGVRVRKVEGCEVAIESGYVLGPHGDEIVVGEELIVDVCREDLEGNAVCTPADPWCSDVPVRRPSGRPMYLALRACDRPTRPVRVMGCGCGCDDSACEYSRIRDGFEIRVLSELPDGYTEPMKPPGTEGLAEATSCRHGRRGPCPSCPRDPWVILADLVLDGEQVVEVRCDPHRRYVASWGAYWFMCQAQDGSTPGFGPASASGHASLVLERRSGESEAETPTASVAIRLGDRWTSVPAAFAVRRGDTLAEVLERAGDTIYRDPSTGGAITLRELYAAAGADLSTKVAGVAAALAPLEGRRLDVEGLRVVRAGLQDLLGEQGRERLDADHAGAPAAAGQLPAVALAVVAERSPIADRLGNATIAEVAAGPRNDFVEMVAGDLKGSRRTTARRQAESVHDAATRLVRLGRAWEEGAPA